MPAANRTGSRAWHRQYPGCANRPSSTKRPVTFDTRATRGADQLTCSATRSSSPSTGSISAE